MASIHTLVVHPTPLRVLPPDPVAYAARDIELGAIDLMRAVEQCQTVTDALALHGLVMTLTKELDRVGSAALDMADDLCGQ